MVPDLAGAAQVATMALRQGLAFRIEEAVVAVVAAEMALRLLGDQAAPV